MVCFEQLGPDKESNSVIITVITLSIGTDRPLKQCRSGSTLFAIYTAIFKTHQ